MADSLQHKLDRVRRPRVQITYDVETNGAMQKMELPFVVGVLADLSGKPSEALKPLKDRKVVNIDRDNFNDVLAKATPRAAFRVDNKLTDENTKIAVELNFRHMEDFEPAKVAQQVAPLRELLEMRNKLTQLMSKMEGNDKLESLLQEVMTNKAKASQLANTMGVKPKKAETAAPTPAPKAAPVPKGAAPAPKPAPAPEPEPAPETDADSELAALLGETQAAAAPREEEAAGAPPVSSSEAAGEEDMDPELAALLKSMKDS
jgi:type VI secretion system protein ImpB